MKYLVGLFAIAVSITSYAADLTVNGATVTTVRAYERNDGTTQVFIALNGHSRVGPNPDVPSINCELWTYTGQVFSTALAAKASGQKVNVAYVAAGTGDAYCKVRYLEISG
mgnify:CR=1 FL=1